MCTEDRRKLHAWLGVFSSGASSQGGRALISSFPVKWGGENLNVHKETLMGGVGGGGDVCVHLCVWVIWEPECPDNKHDWSAIAPASSKRSEFIG